METYEKEAEGILSETKEIKVFHTRQNVEQKVQEFTEQLAYWNNILDKMDENEV